MLRTFLPTQPRVPLWLKLAYTSFVAVLVPSYWWTYGPTNFLYFCDVALLMTVPAIWLESRLLVSMAAVGIFLSQAIWIVDFLGECVGLRLTGLTSYMFDSQRSLFLRGLSLFHFWLPLLLVWLVWRLGYDRRAFWAWTLLAWILMLVCFFLMPPPAAPADNPNMPVNINYVFGLSNESPQTWMSTELYFGLMMGIFPAAMIWPVHFLLARLFGGRKDGRLGPSK
jgi:hypothetical protein